MTFESGTLDESVREVRAKILKECSIYRKASQAEVSWPVLLLSTVFTLWAAHATAFFLHEYAHSFTAWALGWKRNPFGLDYAHPTFSVFLMQSGISQNVDEMRVLASGHGVQAALISAAGVVLGNGLVSFSLSRFTFSLARKKGANVWAMFGYWLTVASLGNLIDYIPVRTFVTGNDLDQDMYAVERGLHCSPWLVLITLGLPTAFAVLHFFLKTEPRSLDWLFPRSQAKRGFLAVLTASFLFAFYGAAGWTGSGSLAHRFSFISVCVVAPIVALITSAIAIFGIDRFGNSPAAHG